jgi:Protein of unknown function (DUF4011)
MATAGTPVPASATQESLSREKLVEAARDGWINRLIDLSRRNNLLFYRPTSSSTLELPITTSLLAFLGDCEALPIRELMATDQDKMSSVRAIARKGLENLEEKGLSTLYVAFGKCSWTADDGGRDPLAPILLIPVSLKLKGQDLGAAEIQVAGGFEVNPVLLHVFNKELNLPLTAETVLNLFTYDQADTARDESELDRHQNALELDTALDFFNAMANKVPGFRADPFAVLGNFSFQKLAMVKDLAGC